MRYLLTAKWIMGSEVIVETHEFEATNAEDALVKAFGDPHRLPDEAADDPSGWFESHTVAKMYENGEPPDDVTLVQIAHKVVGAKKHMMSVHREVERRRKLWDNERQTEVELATLKKLAKKHGKSIA